ncbi:MAG: glycosyltransferase, partial [bacterium]
MRSPNNRLLLLTHNYPRWRGDYAGVFLQSLVRQFAETGIETLVIAPHAAKTERRETQQNITVRRFRYGPESFETLAYTGGMHKLAASPLGMIKFCCYLWSNFWTALYAVWRFKPVLISAQWIAPSGLIGWLLSLLTGKPLYVTSHGTDIVLLQKGRLARRVARSVYRRARKVFVVSNFLK